MRRPHLRDLPELPDPPPDCLLRTLHQGDTNAVAALLSRAFDDASWTPERVHRALIADPNVPETFLIEAAGRLAATASAQTVDAAFDLPHVGFLHWVGVEPDETGRGLGYFVSLRVLHELRARGHTEARLKTEDFRLPALKTYLKLGFRPFLVDDGHADRWEAVAREMPPKYQAQINAALASTPPVDFPLFASVRVRTYELDSFGHVNNAVYFHYLEEARTEFLRQKNIAFSDFARLNVQLVIVEAHIHYLSPAKSGDVVQIWGRFRDIRAASLVIDYELTNQTGRPLARAWTKGAFVSALTGKPCRAPDFFRTAFA